VYEHGVMGMFAFKMSSDCQFIWNIYTCAQNDSLVSKLNV